MKSYNLRDRVLTAVFALALIVFTVTFSIGLPIYFRPFYYIQINTLDMVEDTGYEYEVIKDAYDEVLDYLTLPGKEFGTGELEYSEEGASHFADCKRLFNLNAWGFVTSAAVMVLLLVLAKRGIFELARGAGLNVLFWSGTATLGLFALIAALASIDFDYAFVVFHAIFFPGKDNWVFNPKYDQIINVMPQEFFMNCAILIVTSIILLSVAWIVTGIIIKRREGSK